jgi:hypothetical protein
VVGGRSSTSRSSRPRRRPSASHCSSASGAGRGEDSRASTSACCAASGARAAPTSSATSCRSNNAICCCCCSGACKLPWSLRTPGSPSPGAGGPKSLAGGRAAGGGGGGSIAATICGSRLTGSSAKATSARTEDCKEGSSRGVGCQHFVLVRHSFALGPEQHAQLRSLGAQCGG